MANEINRIAELLLDAWKKADPKSSVALHPVSFVATFADMAKAIIEDRNTRPAAPVEGLEVVAWKHPTSDWASNDYYQVECHCLKVGPMPIPLVTRSQAEAIIAALQSDVTGSASVIEHLKQRANNAEANAEKYREYAAEKSNQVAALQQTLAAETANNAALTARVKGLEQRCAEILKQQDKGWRDLQTRAEALETQLAAARKALEFYADVHKYPAPLTGGMGDLWSDCGAVARAALEAKP